MLKKFKNFFELLYKIDKFLREKQIWRMNGFTFIVLIILLLGFIGMKIDELFEINYFQKPYTFLFGSFIYSIIPYIFYKGDSIKRFIFFGKKERVEEISKKFNSKGYIVFVLFFSYLLIIPILGISLLFQIYDVNYIFDYVLKNLTILIYILLAITTILWFSYHIIYMTVSIQKIKVKITLYIAIGSSFTLVNVKEFEQFSIVISCLIVSYLWIQYLIELKIVEKTKNI